MIATKPLYSFGIQLKGMHMVLLEPPSSIDQGKRLARWSVGIGLLIYLAVLLFPLGMHRLAITIVGAVLLVTPFLIRMAEQRGMLRDNLVIAIIAKGSLWFPGVLYLSPTHSVLSFGVWTGVLLTWLAMNYLVFHDDLLGPYALTPMVDWKRVKAEATPIQHPKARRTPTLD